MNKKQISILGCGWLGLPLAKHLISKNYVIKGSSTSISKKSILTEAGIQPYIFKLGENNNQDIYRDFLSGSDIIIINFPPRRIPDIINIYQEQIRSILPYINDSQKVIFVSSTSVYQNTNDWVTESVENKPEKESGRAVLAVENVLKSYSKENLTVLRLAGLIGYDRVPGRFLANKKEVANGKAPINVIHQDDCIGLIDAIIEHNSWGETINGCADEHPLRKEFYTLAATKANLTPPEFKETESIQFKKISNTKSKTLLDYKYKYPDPLILVR
ncbi:Nucleoside-diphosphate-sugar epimerase [Tenacibaculum sp. MAR_2009_124]|uniref:NAD(P)-dependent oxidoreductase n=1 Tax=Tenacibaculum sp. MAR_2009_124 TaxID=1250059 RepID=UPI00089CC493|nr:NAD(P)-dependent oxidoreductase [Tenacibaculum sp. MAR_2009_124]SEB86432.1 Nucleoside-diphosphate-sugar epimerase [Tenacibaculum sp. MAR_2009_124]